MENVCIRGLTWGENLEKFSKYDIILGADIVYIEETFNALIKTFKHLSTPESIIFLASKIRYDRDLQFFSMMRDDFFVQEVLHDNRTNIKIFKATIKEL